MSAHHELVLGSRYRIIDEVGQGGMARVYKAEDMLLKRPVAVKVLLPEYARDALFVTGFLDEARAAARLQSPYIVNVYDWGQDTDSCYIVIEYIKGIDLRRALVMRGAVQPKKAASIASQVCSALIEAHSMDVIHRDIKPANIMMQKTGMIRLMDFGIAGRSRLDESGAPTMGTVYYMSPEQIRGETPAPSFDLYSLGIVLYELCTGTVPFMSDKPKHTARMHLYDTPIAPMYLSKHVDERMSSIILRAIRKDPTERFANASDMKQALDNYLSSGAIPPTSAFAYPQCWALAFLDGPENVRHSIITLNRPTVIGRAPDCDVSIDDPLLSRKHLLAIPRGQYLEIRDLKSSNGTYVNGEAIRRRQFCSVGHTISIGHTRIRIGSK